MKRTEWLLVWLLRMTAVATLLSLGPLFTPFALLADVHRELGLGELQRTPVVEYLLRSVCAFYAMFGGLLLVLSSDVRKYAAVIRYAAWVGAAFSVLIIVVDHRLALPWWWTWSEGPLTLVVCLAILLLQWRMSEPE